MVERFPSGRTGSQTYTLIVGYQEVRRAARDWQRFTSATPFRVPIPEESGLRPVQQYPIETDPPDHGAYREVIEHRFSRSGAEALRPGLAEVVDDLLGAAVAAGELHAVERFAVPVVTHAIAATLGRPDDAARLASWGLHVFRDPATGRRQANADLDAWLAERVDAALADPGDDLFGDLARAAVEGRPLTRDEMLGYGYLVLAGGRDTVIATIAGSLWHLAAQPEQAAALRRDPARIPAAVEEYLRYFSPLPFIGRTVRHDGQWEGHAFCAGELVALGFAAANHDPEAFDAPDRCVLDRSPNRHVAFGHGPHTCLGAPLARMELALVIERFLQRVHTAHVVRPHRWAPRLPDQVTTGSAFPEDLVLAVG